MHSVLRRFRVRGQVEAVIEATRPFQRRTRQEPGNLRFELWQTLGEPLSFSLLVVFKTHYDAEQHSRAPHAQAWRDAIEPLLEGPILEERLAATLHGPPPLPLPERPAVETSTPFGSPLLLMAKAPKPPLVARAPQLVIEVEAIEVASARDRMPLRAARPCVVLGAFAASSAGAHSVARTVYRFTPPKVLPGALVGTQRLLDVPLAPSANPHQIGVLLASVEENGGSDVRAIYQAFADARELTFWSSAETCPSPRSLDDCFVAHDFSDAAARVEILRQGRSLSDSLEDDTWAGASLGCFVLSGDAPERRARFHTAAEDQRNDWLLALRCSIQ